MKKVSIIIPAYNANKYIGKCIESIENQTYENIEIIIVNDGSTDNTLQICAELSKKYTNIIVIDKQNEGPSIARKNGLEKASGIYISFVDSDDILECNFIDSLVCSLEKNNADISECGYNLVNGELAIISKRPMKEKLYKGNTECVEHYIKKQNTTNYLCNKLYKKELFNDVEFPKFYAGEDACVLLQLFSKCNVVVNISECLYNYVQTNTSLCRSPYNLRKNDSVLAGEYMYNFCSEIYPEYKDYYASYICSYAAQCYAGLKYSDIKNKKVYMNDMKKFFKKYYNRKQIDKLDISFKRKMLLKIFSFSSFVASCIYKKVLKK